MKFLCEHCKAKYQIADDKVAGRTVRMKCRKCGNQIEVRAAVTETSVNSRAPQENRDSAAPPAGAPLPPPKAPLPAAGRGGGLSTSIGGAARPPARPHHPASPAAAPKSQETGALAGAFQRSVQKEQKEEEISVALDLRELSAADEWYAAINGVPVGPVRIAELRRKAALGVVTEESLVWQEGMEEWRPVRAVTELAAVVREAAAGGRVSLLTPPPPEGRTSAPPPPRGASARPASPSARAPTPPTRPPAPLHSTAPSARSNVVPITSRLATAERLDDAPLALHDAVPEPRVGPMVSPDPFALKSPHPPSVNPFMTPAPTAPVTGHGLSGQLGTVPFVASAEPQRKGPNWFIIMMLLAGTAFGVTAAVISFSKPTQVVVTVPSAVAVAATSTPPLSTDSLPQVAPTDTSAAATAPDGGSGKASTVASRGPSNAGARGPTPGAVTDPSLQDLIKHSASGPSGPGDPSSGGGGGGAPLTEAQITAVVRNHQPGVNRTCWERAAGAGTAATVNVTATITVAPTGSVQSVQAAGDDPVMVHCIESAVRVWQFPPSGGQTFKVPFHFVRQ